MVLVELEGRRLLYDFDLGAVFQALYALVGELGLTGGTELELELERVDGTLRGGRVDMVEGDAVLGKPRTRTARLFASQLRERGVASALLALEHVEQRLTMAHKIESGQYSSS